MKLGHLWIGSVLAAAALVYAFRFLRASSPVDVEFTITVTQAPSASPRIQVTSTYRTSAKSIRLSAQVPDRLFAFGDFLAFRKDLENANCTSKYDVVGRADAQFRATRYEIPVHQGAAKLTYTVSPPTYFPYNSCGEARTYGLTATDCLVLCGPSFMLLPDAPISSLSLSFSLPEAWEVYNAKPHALAPDETELWETTVLLGRFSPLSPLTDAQSILVRHHLSIESASVEACRSVLLRLLELLGPPRQPLTIVLCPTGPEQLRIDTTGDPSLLVLDFPQPDVASIRELVRRAVAQWYGFLRLELDTDTSPQSWFATGLSEYLSAKIPAELGMAHVPASDYIEFAWLRDRDARVDLEKPTGNKQQIPHRRLIGAALCYEIDRRLSENGGIETILTNWNGHSYPPRLASDLPDIIALATNRSPRLFGWESDWALDLEDCPPLHAGERTLTFLVSSNTRGYLETCGCKVSQDGGIARRAGYVGQVRSSRADSTLLLDLGNFFPIEKGRPLLDPLVRQEGQLLLECMRLMKYDAILTGPYEYAARAAADPSDLLPSTRVQRLHGGVLCPTAQGDSSNTALVACGFTTIAFVGLSERLEQGWLEDPQERSLYGIAFPQDWKVIKRDLEQASAAAEIVILCGQISPKTIRAIASEPKAVRAVDAVFTGCRPLLPDGKLSGFLDGLFVLHEVTSSYGVTQVDVAIDPSGSILRAAVKPQMLSTDIQPDPLIQDVLNRFYDSLPGEQGPVPDIFYGDDWLTEGFQGADTCKWCHAAQYYQWGTTAHATALDTLVSIHRDKQPKCVVCHVLGLGTSTGFSLQRPDMKLAGVQCEHCHGTARDHILAPRKDNIRRTPPKDICGQCHDDEHSELFDLRFADMIERVSH